MRAILQVKRDIQEIGLEVSHFQVSSMLLMACIMHQVRELTIHSKRIFSKPQYTKLAF